MDTRSTLQVAGHRALGERGECGNEKEEGGMKGAALGRAGLSLVPACPHGNAVRCHAVTTAMNSSARVHTRAGMRRTAPSTRTAAANCQSAGWWAGCAGRRRWSARAGSAAVIATCACCISCLAAARLAWLLLLPLRLLPQLLPLEGSSNPKFHSWGSPGRQGRRARGWAAVLAVHQSACWHQSA